MRRRPPKPPSRPPRSYDRDSYDRDPYDRDPYMDRPEKPQQKGLFGGALTYTTAAILAAVFIIGIGIGLAIGIAQPTTNYASVATRTEIDAASPNSEICLQYGASAVTVDLRAFMTLSPFSVFVTQPKMQPGCVIRRSNWNIIQSQNPNLLTSQQMNECRQRMNTFAYTGDIQKAESGAQVDCVYRNDSAGNMFKVGTGGTPENNEF